MSYVSTICPTGDRIRSTKLIEVRLRASAVQTHGPDNQSIANATLFD